MASSKSLGKKYIEFTIENGKTDIVPHGFTGGDCHRATKPFEDTLGDVSSKKITGIACEQNVTAKG